MDPEEISFAPSNQIVSVKQYFLIIAVLMVVIILGINFFSSLKLESKSKKEVDKTTLTNFPSATPVQKVESAAVGPADQVGPISTKKTVKTPTPTATKQITTPSNTPTPVPANTQNATTPSPPTPIITSASPSPDVSPDPTATTSGN